MLLFVCFAVLAAAVTWAVTRPLLSDTPARRDGDPELAVYRDQLATIETERVDGLIGGTEAEAARAELARRLIKRAEENERGAATATRSGARLALLAAAGLPVFAVALYLALGQPGLPGRPYAARLTTPLDHANVTDLIAKVEAHLRNNPDDGRGWDVLAPVYMRIGEFQQAADAFDRATRLLGDSPQRLAGFARASIMLQNGIVDERARKALEKVRALDTAAIEPQVWLAIAKEQDGDLAGAAADYRSLLAAPGIEDPWKSLLEQRSRDVAAKLGQPPAPAAAPPQSAETANAEHPAAVQDMTPAQRQAFIEQMVGGLAERLKSNGKDLDGWMRLVRAYSVLGRSQDASTALATARTNFAGDASALAQLQALAQTLGLGS